MTHESDAPREPTSAKSRAKKTGIPFTPEQRIGVLARDRVTGFTGHVVGRLIQLSGNIQFAIQPLDNEPSKYPDAQYLDWHMLEEIGEGVAGQVPPRDPTVTLSVGDKVRDTISGLKGFIVEEHLFQNGCVYFTVSPINGVNVFGEIAGGTRLPHQRLEPLLTFRERLKKAFTRKEKPDTPPAAKTTKAKEPAPETAKPQRSSTGGPGDRLPARSVRSGGGHG